MTHTTMTAMILLATCLAGCEPTTNRHDERFLFAKARAAVAFAAAECERSNPNPPTTTCDDCQGTGEVPSGDGLARVPCPCSAACECGDGASVGEHRRNENRKTVNGSAGASPSRRATSRETRRAGSTIDDSVPPRQRRLLYFTASWCAACRSNEPTFAALSQSGWQIGPGEENHIQTVNLEARPDLAGRFAVSAVPTWVLIDGDREVRRCCGVLGPFDVGRMFE